jgi:hypothetical protein
MMAAVDVNIDTDYNDGVPRELHLRRWRYVQNALGFSGSNSGVSALISRSVSRSVWNLEQSRNLWSRTSSFEVSVRSQHSRIESVESMYHVLRVGVAVFIGAVVFNQVDKKTYLLASDRLMYFAGPVVYLHCCVGWRARFLLWDREMNSM